MGGIAKAGLIINRKSIFLDFFGDYSWIKIHNHNTSHGKVIPHSADLSGWSLEVGLGYRFGCKDRSMERSKNCLK